ncbi:MULTISPECIES: methyltransferase domain-containing protein [unclassified Brevibacterium]|uniref:methyltransferase domain-containing protein n=1 Tax=unclassified Brevibacterium TaxID=2614124 RepID=UPI001091FC56|nr:methyltransferase domain-containing protein [Brevibacterium sp. S22]TGD32085.1 methyltransferase domain-containing protein [Brevibacterium sp. S22]
MTEQNRYVLGESAGEHSRLRDQSVVFDPLTRQLHNEAGITAGMSVLDIGTGAGDVAVIAADLVGPDGHVLAVDRDRIALDGARNRLRHRPEIEFAEADLGSLALGRQFDAIVGRAVLMHLRSPVEVLERLAQHLRPGGLLVMHELDLSQDWASVETPLLDRVRQLVLQAFETFGIHSRLGRDLFAAFRAAGLPDPHLTLSAPVGGGAEAPSFGWVNALNALLPYLEEQGIVNADELGVDSLTQRLTDELDAEDATLLGPVMYGAYCRLG